MDKIPLEEVLEKDLTTAVDFEITLAALLSAILLISPGISDLLQFPTIAIALILLVLTLLRQMAIISQLSRTELILNKTSPPLVIATTYAVLYATLWIGSVASNTIPIQPLTIALLISTLAPPILIAFYEFFYRDFMLTVSIIMYNRYVDLDDSKFKNRVARRLGSWLAKSELSVDEQPQEIDRIRDIGESSLDDVNLGTRVGTRLGVAIALVLFIGLLLLPAAVVVYYVSAPVLHLIKLVILALGLAVSTNFVIVLVRFLFARFGRDDFDMSNWRYFRYSLIIYILFVPRLLSEQGHSVNTDLVAGLGVLFVFGPIALRMWQYKRQEG